MKKLVFLLFVLSFLACGEKEEMKLCGTWRMISGHYEGPDFSVSENENTRICYKILADDNFAVVEMFPSNPDSGFFAAFGEFELTGNTYREIYKASNVPGKIGENLEFSSEIKGDVGRIQQKRQGMILKETWQRIEEL